MAESAEALALVSAFCSAIGTILVQRGLGRSNIYAGFWINVTVGALTLWAAVLLFVPHAEWDWSALPYFAFSGIIGTACGRLCRVTAIEKVGAPVAAAVSNLAPLFTTVLAIALFKEDVTPLEIVGTVVIVFGTAVLSLSGKQSGFPIRYLAYPLLTAICFGMVQVVRKMGLSDAGPLFDAALNVSTAMVAATTYVFAAGHGPELRCDLGSLFYLGAGGAAENASALLVIVALGLGDVSLVSPLAATAPLFVLPLALLFPSGAQRPGWRVAAGTLLIVAGVVLLTDPTRLVPA
jgi:uncharacterized membrane protein